MRRGKRISMPDRRELLIALWLFGVFAAYLWQFRDLVGPVLKVLGL